MQDLGVALYHSAGQINRFHHLTGAASGVIAQVRRLSAAIPAEAPAAAAEPHSGPTELQPSQA